MSTTVGTRSDPNGALSPNRFDLPMRMSSLVLGLPYAGGHRGVVHGLQLLLSVLGRVGSAHASFVGARPPALRAAVPREASISDICWPAAEVRSSLLK